MFHARELAGQSNRVRHQHKPARATDAASPVARRLEYGAAMPTNLSNASAVDLTNRSARAKQLAIAIVLGAVAATVVYFITHSIAEPDRIVGRGLGMQARPFYSAWSFIYASSAIAGALVLSATLAIGKRIGRSRA